MLPSPPPEILLRPRSPSLKESITYIGEFGVGQNRPISQKKNTLSKNHLILVDIFGGLAEILTIKNVRNFFQMIFSQKNITNASLISFLPCPKIFANTVKQQKN
jgi:hypothetical protein